MIEKRLRSLRQGSAFFSLGTMFTFFSGRGTDFYVGNTLAMFPLHYNYREHEVDATYMNLIGIFSTNLLGYCLEGYLSEKEAYKVSALIIIAIASILINRVEAKQQLAPN